MNLKFKSRNRNSIGSSTIFVIVVAAAIITTSVFIFNTAISTQKSTAANVDKTRATYEAEGVIKGMVNLTKQFVAQSANITTASLSEFISPQIASLTPPGFVIKNWSVNIENNSQVKDLPSGPFAGMQSDLRVVNLKVTLTSNISGTDTSAEMDGVVAGITFTQFGVFSFYGWAATSIVNKVIIAGRVFANDYIYTGSSVGNFANGNLGTEFVSSNYYTSGGWIANAAPIGGTTIRTFVASDDSGLNYRELKRSASHGCTNCDDTGLSWKEYALAQWNGRLQDSAHGVPKIRIKTADTPRVQRGTYGDNIPERLLIDPIVTSDSSSVRQAKFAYKADIRIINGVWYLKNPSNESDWPGIPVWSDHPGSFRTWDEETTEGLKDVGQADIAAFMASHFPRHSWPVNTVPKKFSFYEYDQTAGKIKDNSEGVISYGNLVGPSGSAIPGGYVSNNISANESSYCYDNATSTHTQCTNCTDATILNRLVPITSNVVCIYGTDADIAHRIVNATRSGYRFGLWQNHSPNPASHRVARSKVYPMNFDLARF